MMFLPSLLITALLPSALGAPPKCNAKSSSSSSIATKTDAMPSSISSSIASSSATGATGSRAAPSVSASALGGNLSANQTTTGKLPLGAKLIDHLHWPGPTTPSIKTDSGLDINAEIYLVDLDGTTPEQVAQYHADGKIVLCYFSAGGWDTFRTDSLSYDGACVCGGTLSKDGCSTSDNKQASWDAWWLDIHSPECRSKAEVIMGDRFKRAAEKVCDGVNLDNIDSYINPDQKHGNTKADQIDYLKFLSKTARENDLIVGVNNGGDMLKGEDRQAFIDGFDYVIVESCRKWNECDVYDPFLEAGKPTYQFEYDTSISSCPEAKEGQHLVVYNGVNLDSSKITLIC